MKTAQVTGFIREAGKFSVVFTVWKDDEIFGNVTTPRIYKSKDEATREAYSAQDYFNETGKFPAFV